MQDDQFAHDMPSTRERFGPRPEAALRAFVDLGLDDCEIGRYHALSAVAVSMLRRHYRIATVDGSANTDDPLIDELDDDLCAIEILRTQDDRGFLFHPRSADGSDCTNWGLRQFALSMRSKLFGGQ